MSLRSIVKVSHITNLSDARYCAGMGVEMLGFRVVPGQEYYMPHALFQDIRGWISGPKIVAEAFGITSATELDEILRMYSPDYLELSREEFETYKDHVTLPCLVYCDNTEDVRSTAGAGRGISHVVVNEEISCREISPITNPVLSRVSSIEELHRRISDGCFQGYVLDGPEEIRPGVTNYEQLGSILEMLEDEN